MLETVWFVLWGVLWAVYFMLDGFDLGVGVLMPFVAKDERERRTVYRSIGPFWDGNEVWLVTAGGVTFAAFPAAYAVLFSSFYTPLMLMLFALIIRAVALELRGKVDSNASRKFWDLCLCAGSFAAALLLGVAFANIFKGIPIDGEGLYHGSLLDLLNPYGLMGGVLFLALFLLHGALWLGLKTEGPVHEGALRAARGMWLVVVLFAVVFLVFTVFETKLFANYLRNPVLFAIPVITLAALFLTRLFIGGAAWFQAWCSHALTIVGITLFGVVGLYPNLLPSSLSPEFSVTAQNSASSPLTLTIMLVVALVFVPVVLIYQGWAYRVFRGKVREESLEFGERY